MSRWVAASTIPTTANRAARLTARVASSRGNRSGKGARAPTATSTAKGSRKNSKRLRPEPGSLDHSKESEAKARNAEAGTAISRGGA
jgi:hypothetical protein